MKNHFVTSDFYTAAFLRCSGLAIVGLNKSDTRRFRFIFEDSDERSQLVSDFFTGNAKVDAQRFIAAIKDLKSLMYSDAVASIGDDLLP